jgi:hypothetical protein
MWHHPVQTAADESEKILCCSNVSANEDDNVSLEIISAV